VRKRERKNREQANKRTRTEHMHEWFIDRSRGMSNGHWQTTAIQGPGTRVPGHRKVQETVPTGFLVPAAHSGKEKEWNGFLPPAARSGMVGS